MVPVRHIAAHASMASSGARTPVSALVAVVAPCCFQMSGSVVTLAAQ